MIIVSRILDFNTTRGLVILICKFCTVSFPRLKVDFFLDLRFDRFFFHFLVIDGGGGVEWTLPSLSGSFDTFAPMTKIT